MIYCTQKQWDAETASATIISHNYGGINMTVQNIEFTKMQGTGNDFVVLDCVAHPEYLEFALIPALVSKMCDRHYGIGADGLVLVLPSEIADIQMRIINSDGSEAEMCGNGIRCFARFVYEQNIVRKESMTVETLAGVLVPRMILDEAGIVTGVEVDMGEPILDCAGVPMIKKPPGTVAK